MHRCRSDTVPPGRIDHPMAFTVRPAWMPLAVSLRLARSTGSRGSRDAQSQQKISRDVEDRANFGAVAAGGVGVAVQCCRGLFVAEESLNFVDRHAVGDQ